MPDDVIQGAAAADQPDDGSGEPTEQQWTRDRLDDLRELPLHPNNLTGSWFHKIEGGQIVWEGMVLGEPQPQVYLVEVTALERAKRFQRLVPHVEMIGEGIEWRFYDSEEWMRHAFIEHEREV